VAIHLANQKVAIQWVAIQKVAIQKVAIRKKSGHPSGDPKEKWTHVSQWTLLLGYREGIW